ncbi:MAG: hypothetical protein GY762_01995 [Proteobacteria bacterium]|nr:hypothetical protein [Pseudomonadota bacterium]
MGDSASSVVSAFSQALQNISPRWTRQQRLSRKFLRSDPLEQLIPNKLIEEGLEKLLNSHNRTGNPLVLLMDRAGGGDGVRAAASLMPLIGRRWSNVSFVHVAFSTPARGVGALIRNSLTKTGAEYGVDVHVVAHNRPFEGLEISRRLADQLTDACDLIMTFAPGGAAGLAGPEPSAVQQDVLLRRSHVAVLSYLDPESLISEIGFFDRLVGTEPALEAIRFNVQVEIDNAFQELGTTILGYGGDARDKLWALVDNGRRHRYKILIEPIQKDAPSGSPLLCPCQTIIERDLGESVAIERIVPAGATLVTTAKGKDTLQ